MLLLQWKDLEPEFQKAKAALMAAKDRDDMYTLLVAEDKLDEALDQAEEYGYTMTEAKRCLSPSGWSSRPSPPRTRTIPPPRTSWPHGTPTSRPTRG